MEKIPKIIMVVLEKVYLHKGHKVQTVNDMVLVELNSVKQKELSRGKFDCSVCSVNSSPL